MRRIRPLGLICLMVLAAGCVTEAHRRINEGVRQRGESIAANEAAPPEVRQQGAEVAAGAAALQVQAVPKPETAVQGTTEELAADIAKAGAFDATLATVKGLGKAALSAAGAKWEWAATAISALTAVGLWFRKRKAQAEKLATSEVAGVLGRAVEAVKGGKPVAEVLASEAKALVHVNVGDVEKALADAKAGEI